MFTFTWIALLSSAYPLGLALQANRPTSLIQALAWAVGAWVGWLITALVACYGPPDWYVPTRYLALCLTGCAAIAVLGARRPGVGAWNFVVAGLLAVFLLQWFEGLDRLRDGPIRPGFLAATLGVGVLNYLPTRLGLAAMSLAAGTTLVLAVLVWPTSGLAGIDRSTGLGTLLVATSPWLALAGVGLTGARRGEFNQIWLGFRDRFGVVWAQRLREQYNRAAAHAGWRPLAWHGLATEEATKGEQATLSALLKRFGPHAARYEA